MDINIFLDQSLYQLDANHLNSSDLSVVHILAEKVRWVERRLCMLDNEFMTNQFSYQL
jgi:hypothetical protein